MAAPGTLIPADIFSSKDSSMKSYMPKSTKIPGVPPLPTKDSGLPSRPVSNNTNGGSSQNIEPLISITGPIDSGKRVLPSSQLDHIPSSAIGSYMYKGGRGSNAVGGGLRMNVNIVPYSQNNAEDNKNLFTELNPFQIKGSGKALMQSTVENKNEELQRAKNNQMPGQPSVPLMWKNRHAFNEVPVKKEHDHINYRESNDFTMPASTSSAAPGRIHSDGLKSRYNYGVTPVENNERASSNGAESEAAWAEWKNYRLSLEVVGNNSNAFPRNNRLDLDKVHENNAIGGQDARKASDYRVKKNNPKLSGTESSTSSVYSIPPQVDPVIDDVGDCEIPWEDLVIGERIGLGNSLNV